MLLLFFNHTKQLSGHTCTVTISVHGADARCVNFYHFHVSWKHVSLTSYLQVTGLNRQKHEVDLPCFL